MANAVIKNLNSSQTQQLEQFGNKVNMFGANFATFNGEGELLLLCEGGKFKSDREQLTKSALEVLELKKHQSSNFESDSTILRFGNRENVLAGVVTANNNLPEFVMMIDLDKKKTNSLEQENGIDVDEVLCQMLELVVDKIHTKAQAEYQIEQMSFELSLVYEELVLLHKLSTNIRVNESDANYLQMACDSLTDIVLVEGIAILQEKIIDGECRHVLAAGSGVIDMDERFIATLYNRLDEQIAKGKEALLDSDVDTPFEYDWNNNIKSIIAVPLYGKDKSEADSEEDAENVNRIIGLMVAINRINKPDFDSTDIKLFNSVANGCAAFVENGRLFRELKGLFIGSLKALTNSIDAKDRYTHGHSQRVAFISRWIAERVAEHQQLPQEQIHKIYLAGLLHDIGKMGVSEAVLRKEGKLTKEEFEHIRSHPTIGASILGEIEQMRDIVPGVLCHHERVDGKGYPNCLIGEQVPLIGKIIALADSFDAMTSKRVYRKALTLEETLARMEKGLGTQFDEKIGRIFLDSDICHLWSIIQDQINEVYGGGNFSEYGSAAVGVLIR